MTLRSPEPTDTPRVLEGIGIGACASHYGAWLCDLWGVVHNGIEPFAAALKSRRAYRRGGGVVVFITNAPRPSSSGKWTTSTNTLSSFSSGNPLMSPIRTGV